VCAIVRKVRGDKFYRFITGGRRIAAARKDRTVNSIMCAVVRCSDATAKEIFLARTPRAGSPFAGGPS